MKFVMAIALLTLLLALSKPIPAAEWPTKEIQASCPKSLKEVWKDGTTAYYGCGEKNTTPTNNIREAEQPPKLDHQIRGLETAGLTKTEIITALHEAWRQRVSQETFQKTYKYEEADILFEELRSALLKSPFPDESVWPHFNIDYGVKKVIEHLCWTGHSFGKRYGKLVLELLVELSDRHPKNELLVESQRYALEGMIFQQEPLFSGQEEEKTTAEEKRFYAEKLLDFYSSRQELRRLPYLPDEQKSLLNEVAPDILQQLEALVTSRETQ